MNLLLIRDQDDHKSTTGRLFINGGLFCFTLEDEYREGKVAGETRIPAGRYKLGLRDYGPMAARYKERFGFESMIEILRVPNFTDILFHIGNVENDTAGCILLGAEKSQIITKDGITQRVLRSTDTYLEFYAQVAPQVPNGAELLILDNF